MPASLAPAQDPLLSRDQFRERIFARSLGACVLCGKPAADAHHILERKLYPDGGYYLSNGAAVCEQCHLDCEYTRVSVERVRQAAGITDPVLPPGFGLDTIYDKWGNRQWSSGLRSVGPLEQDTGMRRALAAGGVLGLLMPAAYREDA